MEREDWQIHIPQGNTEARNFLTMAYTLQLLLLGLQRTMRLPHLEPLASWKTVTVEVWQGQRPGSFPRQDGNDRVC